MEASLFLSGPPIQGFSIFPTGAWYDIALCMLEMPVNQFVHTQTQVFFQADSKDLGRMIGSHIKLTWVLL